MDAPIEDDGLNWFGEGFDGFPKRLPEDCVECIVYVIDAKLQTAFAQGTRLNQILKASEDLKRKHSADYIWQRDAFELKLRLGIVSPTANGEDSSNNKQIQHPPHLRGRTNFGDSVADEWLVVYLLLELSKQFVDAWIRVYDTDGEFLLIEAANALPKWLNPEIAENRVWISNGHLRIIPLLGDSPSRNLSEEDALKFIREQPEQLTISPFIEDEAFYRLREYPSAISSSLHHALISIPRRAACILHHNSAYISPAIEAFYLRDPVSLRPLSFKDTSSLNFPPEDFVTVSTKFTKVGFAQVKSQIFDPPPAWTGVIPRMKDTKAESGMKVTCGFEMLISDPQNQDKKAVREIKLLLEDVAKGDEALPSDDELSQWSQRQDDESWLDINYNEFENELNGRARSNGDAKSTGFGDASTQDSLRKMVSRFQDFLQDDDAGAEGVDDLDEDDENSVADSAEEQRDDLDDEEFKAAMKESRAMSPAFIESSGLLEEARRLALEDAEEQSDYDEDEEMQKVMELMEQELKGHGALDLNSKSPKQPKIDASVTEKPFFGPERPPGMLASDAMLKQSAAQETVDEEIGPGDVELSSDDEDFNDIDLGLAKNMLESFKAQGGTPGPAGNLMKAMGFTMPRDEGEEDD